MLGDVRILARGAHAGGDPDELLLDTERVALQALFDMVRRFKVGFDVDLHKRTLERGLLSLIGPERGERGLRQGLARAEHANAPVDVDGVGALRGAHRTWVSTCCARGAQTSALRGGPAGPRGRGGWTNRWRSACASSAGDRATASTSTTPSSPRRRA